MSYTKLNHWGKSKMVRATDLLTEGRTYLNYRNSFVVLKGWEKKEIIGQRGGEALGNREAKIGVKQPQIYDTNQNSDILMETEFQYYIYIGSTAIMLIFLLEQAKQDTQQALRNLENEKQEHQTKV